MLMTKAVFVGMVSPFFGLVNFEEGILSTEGIKPIGQGLHDPDWICWPFVMGRLGAVRQKLMKLLVDVNEATCPKYQVHNASDYETYDNHKNLPAAGTDWPSFANPVAIIRGSRASQNHGLVRTLSS
jgi:hypothetical protein